MESKIQTLVRRYRYCSVSDNVLYWSCGRTSGRIAIPHIDEIEFHASSATIRSKIGTDFGYHEVVFTKYGANYTEVIDNVVYYNFVR